MTATNFREEPIRSNRVLRSAKGQPCSARFPGICCADAATTVWAHLNGARFGKGAMIKAHDILGFHACFACHAYYDVGHGTRPVLSSEQLLEYVLGAVCETYVRLVRAKVIIVPLDPEHLSHDKPVKPRKSPEHRAKVPAGKLLQSRSEWPEGRKMQSRQFARKSDLPEEARPYRSQE